MQGLRLRRDWNLQAEGFEPHWTAIFVLCRVNTCEKNARPESNKGSPTTYTRLNYSTRSPEVPALFALKAKGFCLGFRVQGPKPSRPKPLTLLDIEAS